MQRLLQPSDGTIETSGKYGSYVKLFDLTLTVSAPEAYGSGNTDKYGAVYVYTTHGGSRVYTQRGKLVPATSSPDCDFGKSVSIDREQFIAVGVPNDTVHYERNYTNAGSVYLYGRINGTWTHLTKIIHSEGIDNHYYGNSVSLMDGRLIIGGPGNNGVYYFSGHGDSWSLNHQLTVMLDVSGTNQIIVDNAITDDAQLGYCVDQDPGRNLIMASAPNYNGGRGAIFIFEMPTPGTTWKGAATPKLIPSDPSISDNFGRNFVCRDKELIVTRNSTNGLAYWAPSASWDQLPTPAPTPTGT